jgi:hypothetical protein
MDARRQHFRKPLVRCPRLAPESERERIGRGHAEGVDHQLTGGDVPVGVAVIEQLGGEGEQRGDHRGEQGHGGPPVVQAGEPGRSPGTDRSNGCHVHVLHAHGLARYG